MAAESSTTGKQDMDKLFLNLMELLQQALAHFPNHEKHGLTLHIRNQSYKLWDLITQSRKRGNKTDFVQMDVAHEQLRMQLKLSLKLGYFNYTTKHKDDLQVAEQTYKSIEHYLNRLGAMIGQWMKEAKVY